MPRKRGIKRFVEVIVRDIGNLTKLSLLFFACCIPALAMLVCAILIPAMAVPFLILVALAAIPVGSATAALYFSISKMLRDDPGFIWYDFKRKFKENFHVATVPGMVCTELFAIQIYALLSQLFWGTGIDSPSMVVFWILSVLMLGMLSPFFFLQAGYLKLGIKGLLNNSLILMMTNLPRSLMGALSNNLLWALYVFFWPTSYLVLPLIPLFGSAITVLMVLMWIWPVVDGQFKIEETLQKQATSEQDTN